MTPDPNSPDERRPAESNGSRRDARAQKAQAKARAKAEADARAKAEKLQKAQAKKDAEDAKAQAKAEAAEARQDAQEAAARSKQAALEEKARAKAEAAKKAKAEARDAEAAEEARPTKERVRQKSDATRSSAKGRIGAAAGRKRPANGKKRPANGKKRPANGKKRPANGKKRPANGKKRPANGKKRPANGKKRPANGKKSPANGRKTTEKARKAAARKLHKQRRRARIGIEVDGETVRIAEVHGDELVWARTHGPDVSVPDALENWKSGQKRARSSTVTVTWAGPRSYLRRLDKPKVPAKALKQFIASRLADQLPLRAGTYVLAAAEGGEPRALSVTAIETAALSDLWPHLSEWSVDLEPAEFVVGADGLFLSIRNSNAVLILRQAGVPVSVRDLGSGGVDTLIEQLSWGNQDGVARLDALFHPGEPPPAESEPLTDAALEPVLELPEPDPFAPAPGAFEPPYSDPFAPAPDAFEPPVSDASTPPPEAPDPVDSGPSAPPPGVFAPSGDDPFAPPPGAFAPSGDDPFAPPPGAFAPSGDDPFAPPPGAFAPPGDDPFAPPPAAPAGGFDLTSDTQAVTVANDYVTSLVSETRATVGFWQSQELTVPSDIRVFGFGAFLPGLYEQLETAGVRCSRAPLGPRLDLDILSDSEQAAYHGAIAAAINPSGITVNIENPLVAIAKAKTKKRFARLRAVAAVAAAAAAVIWFLVLPYREASQDLENARAERDQMRAAAESLEDIGVLVSDLRRIQTTLTGLHQDEPSWVAPVQALGATAPPGTVFETVSLGTGACPASAIEFTAQSVGDDFACIDVGMATTVPGENFVDVANWIRRLEAIEGMTVWPSPLSASETPGGPEAFMEVSFTMRLPNEPPYRVARSTGVTATGGADLTAAGGS